MEQRKYFSRSSPVGEYVATTAGGIHSGCVQIRPRPLFHVQPPSSHAPGVDSTGQRGVQAEEPDAHQVRPETVGPAHRVHQTPPGSQFGRGPDRTGVFTQYRSCP